MKSRSNCQASSQPSILEELSLLEDVSPELAPKVLELRRQCAKDYDLQTAAELMLLDQAILGYVYALLMGEPETVNVYLQHARLGLMVRFNQMFVRNLSMMRTFRVQDVGDEALDSLVGQFGH